MSRANLTAVLALAALGLHCSPPAAHLEGLDGSVLDASEPDAGGDDAGDADAGEPDAGEPDSGAPDAGPDASVPDAGPTDAGFSFCFEAEAATLEGATAAWPAPAETVGGVVELGANGTGALRQAFTLERSLALTAWVRVRAPSHNNNSLSVFLDDAGVSNAAVWDVPVTPVRRWVRVDRRGDAGTFDVALEPAWPGLVAAGPHQLALLGREPSLELDAVCLLEAAAVPPERFLPPPVHATRKSLATFGAVGDGVADDTNALKAALAALAPNDTLFIPRGRYRFTAPLTLTTAQVTLLGEGEASVLFADLPASESGRGLTVQGGQESNQTPLVADALFLGHEVQVVSSSPVGVGDAVLVTCDDWGPLAPNVGLPLYRFRANTAHVAAARVVGSAKVLTLDRPLLSDFLVSRNAKLERFNGLRGVVLEQLAFEGPDRGSPGDAGADPDIDLVGLLRCDQCFAVDLTLRHFRKSGLDSFRSLDLQVVRAHALDAVDTGGGGHGYGVSVNRTQGMTVRDSRFDGVFRHGVPISWGARESFVFRNVFDRRAVQALEKLGSVDIHGEDDYENLVEANTVLQGDPGIIVGGGGSTHGNDGPWNVVRDNELSGTTDGVAIYKQTGQTVVEGNRLRGQSGSAVRVESGSDNTFVWNNELAGWGAAGVSVTASNGADIRGNRFTPGTGPAVRIATGSSGYTVRGNQLGDAGVVHPDAGDVSGNR